MTIEPIKNRIERVRKMRLSQPQSKATNDNAKTPHRFARNERAKKHERYYCCACCIIRKSRLFTCWEFYQKAALYPIGFGLYDAPLWNLALIASRLHLVWIATVCGKLKTDFKLFQHARLEHLSYTRPHPLAKNRPDQMRREYFACPRSPFSSNHSRPL